MDASKKSTKPQFLAPGILSKSKNKSKFGMKNFLPGFLPKDRNGELCRSNSTMSVHNDVVNKSKPAQGVSINSNAELESITNSVGDKSRPVRGTSIASDFGLELLINDVGSKSRPSNGNMVGSDVDFQSFLLNGGGSKSKPVQGTSIMSDVDFELLLNNVGYKPRPARENSTTSDDETALGITSKKKWRVSDLTFKVRDEPESRNYESEETSRPSSGTDLALEVMDQPESRNQEKEDFARPLNGTDLDNASRRKKRDANAKNRGVNKCTRVANLKECQKLQVDFFCNGPVGDNQKDLVRHMGKLIRDRSIVPVRVHKWNELGESVMEHLWLSITNKFQSDHMDIRREAILHHMKRLWQNWRGLMKRDIIDKNESIENVLKNVPNHLTREDWEWLVKEHYMSDEFKKMSERNSENRASKNMLHRTGSKPIKEVVWSEMGGKDGNVPSVSEIFKKTRMQKCGSLDEEAADKLDEIICIEKDQSLSRFDVIEKAFGQQGYNHVICYGYGTKPKDVRGDLPSRVELTCKLRDKDNEIGELRTRLDEMEEIRKKEHVEHDAEVKKLREQTDGLTQKVDILMTMALQQFRGSDADHP